MHGPPSAAAFRSSPAAIECLSGTSPESASLPEGFRLPKAPMARIIPRLESGLEGMPGRRGNASPDPVGNVRTASGAITDELELSSGRAHG